MRGHDSIVRMRLAGYRPRMVWIFVQDRDPEKAPVRDPENLLSNGMLPEIQVGPSDADEALDLRAVAGLIVHLQGGDIARLRNVFSRIREFSPARIITSNAELFHDWRPE